MARTKTTTRPETESRKQNTIIAYKGTEEFEIWLDDLADLAGLPVPITVDQALKAYAESLGHRPMPRRVWPRRLPAELQASA